MAAARKVLKFGANLETQHLLDTSRGVFVIGRHTNRSDHTESGISALGERRAEWAAHHLPKNMLLHVRYAARKSRHKATAQIVYREYQGKRGKIREMNSLNIESFVKDPAQFSKLAKEIPDPAITHLWLAGGIGPEVIESPVVVGKKILTDVLTQFKEIENPHQRNLLVAVSSGGAEGAILASLGIDYRLIKPKKPRAREKPTQGEMLQYTEGMLFFVGPNNELILKYRGRPFIIKKHGDYFIAKKG